MITPLATVTVALLAAAPVAEAAPKRVAVLELQARWSGRCASAIWRQDPAVREQCDALALFADEARGGALASLRPPEWLVMTRENTGELVREMGGRCTEGECEVETARLVGAAMVLSGQVAIVDGTWVVTLKLHDATSAALLSTIRIQGRSRLEALKQVRREAERLVQEGLAPISAEERVSRLGRRRPPPGSIEVGGAVAYRRPLGRLDGGRTLAGVIPSMTGLEAAASYRATRRLVGGLLFSVSWGDSTTGTGRSTAVLFRIGAQGTLDFGSDPRWIPWVGGRLAFDALETGAEWPGGGFGNEVGLQGGIDYGLFRGFLAGLFFEASAGKYVSISEDWSPASPNFNLNARTWHGWLGLGLRFRFTGS